MFAPMKTSNLSNLSTQITKCEPYGRDTKALIINCDSIRGTDSRLKLKKERGKFEKQTKLVLDETGIVSMDKVPEQSQMAMIKEFEDI
ncbi:hypothetical protein A4A49_52720 [Nicotiana attenuata]|uniref:Uncharacterized protein n=1 Tax=Nicotiana attenuata TaxID=49451 RepID=A0A1J6J613_NICAT|nr:hypothetical protein A4A49_52720 [Nicotiana attenuata]